MMVHEIVEMIASANYWSALHMQGPLDLVTEAKLVFDVVMRKRLMFVTPETVPIVA